jgi:hypothetical protein
MGSSIRSTLTIIASPSPSFVVRLVVTGVFLLEAKVYPDLLMRQLVL